MDEKGQTMSEDGFGGVWNRRPWWPAGTPDKEIAFHYFTEGRKSLTPDIEAENKGLKTLAIKCKPYIRDHIECLKKGFDKDQYDEIVTIPHLKGLVEQIEALSESEGE